jgi:hypothetical protein
VLDFNGNEIKRFTSHSATVNDLCIDETGECKRKHKEEESERLKERNPERLCSGMREEKRELREKRE